MNFEIMFIVRSDIEENAVKETVATFEKILNDNGAKVTETKSLGQKEFAYVMNGHKSGYYYLTHATVSDIKSINEFNRLAQINENIVRHICINLDK